jgi:hypothetical protein
MKAVGTKLLLSTQNLAATGSTQADAAPITTGPMAIVHITGADGTKGALLPPATSGKMIIIKNSDAANAVLKVWPAGTNTINALGASNSISMAAKTSATFAVLNGGTGWVTIPTVPS